MASAIARPLRTSRKQWTCLSCRLAQLSARFNSTEAAPSPLLSKIKGDLKTAMKNKDAARLNVLRAVITEVNNSSKTDKPIRSDLQILALLKKRKTGAQTAAKEAEEAQRQDLSSKQHQEIEVIDEYAGTVQMMSEQEITQAVQAVIDAEKKAAPDAQIKEGTVMKILLAKDGPLDGKNVDKKEVVQAIKSLLQN